MRECVIHGAKIPDWDALYTQLENDLSLPFWFGRNLDALYDCLTEMGDAQITIYQWGALAETLGKKAEALREVLTDAGLENPCLVVCLLDEEQDEI